MADTPNDDALVDKVEEAIKRAETGYAGYVDLAIAAIAVLRPAIRAEALREAAGVANDYEGEGMDGGYDCHLGDAFRTRSDINRAILALIDKERE